MAITPAEARVRELPSDANISGRNFGPDELKNLAKVLESGTLNCTKGTWVNQFEANFAESYGASYVRCVTSGTAAVHAAIAAIDTEPGDEVITTGITDMGAITPIIYQAAIPVFADVDPYTYNVTAESIEKVITPRTKAIIVTHLFGNMCEMGPIMELARSKNIPVIEDAAQAFFSELDGKRAGLIGDIGAFSLQQGKHMTTGEGGIVIVNNKDYERRVRLFVDKAWGYGDPKPDHYFLALNYRMTELQGAVACAQLEKVDKVVESRVRNANLMTDLIEDVAGVHAPRVTPNSLHTYWKYCLHVDADEIEGGVDAFAKALKSRGIFSAPRYIQKPAFQCEVIRDQVTFGTSGFPFRGPHREGLPPIEYKVENYPGTFQALATICVLPWNEFYTEDDVRYIAEAVANAARELKK